MCDATLLFQSGQSVTQLRLSNIHNPDQYAKYSWFDKAVEIMCGPQECVLQHKHIYNPILLPEWLH